jgi:hypothetical protein
VCVPIVNEETGEIILEFGFLEEVLENSYCVVHLINNKWASVHIDYVTEAGRA